MKNNELRKKNVELLRSYTVSELKIMLKNTNNHIAKVNKDMNGPLSTGRTPKETGWSEMKKLLIAHQEQADLINFILKEREMNNFPLRKKSKITKSQIKSLLHADDHSLLAANAIRQNHLKLISIKKEFRNEIEDYSKTLQIISNNGYYLGESLYHSEAILKHIKDSVEAVAIEKRLL